MKTIFKLIMGCAFLFSLPAYAQPKLKDGKMLFSLDDSSKHYVRLTFLNQTWLRRTQMNPGVSVYGDDVSYLNDIGLRRTRIQLYGRLTDRIFFYTQFGQNNFRLSSQKFTGAFFHDVISEFRMGDYLEIGAGLTGWSGLSRYASPSVGSILSLDAPLYQQATNSINDQFLRKLSLYAKGKIWNIDYRIALTQPMDIYGSVLFVPGPDTISSFAPNVSNLQTQGYFKYEILEKESNVTPYHTGTYLGDKRVFTIGAGFIHQPDAMWHVENSDTAFNDMILIGVDAFYDAPLKNNKGSITAYIAFNNYDFGSGYIREIGVMNPGTGVISGSGNAFPMIGTGITIYGQLGYCLPHNSLGNGTMQFYAAVQRSDYDGLDREMMMIEGGLNWFIRGRHSEKLSLNYQDRPYFSNNTFQSRKGMLQLQFQISI